VCVCVRVCACVCVQRKAEFHEHYATGAVYVLSMAWFRDWENFVCCKTNGPLTAS